MRNSIFMKALSLTISILFAVSNITYAAPLDYSALRQPSAAVSPAGIHIPPVAQTIATELSTSTVSLTTADSSAFAKAASAGTAEIETEKLIGNMSLKEAADEARLILEGKGRYLYSGDYYLAVSRTTKEDGLMEDKPSLIGKGVIVGLGDSDADLFFLETKKLRNRHYLPFYLGGPVADSNIIEVKKRQIEGAKEILKLIAKTLEKKLTYGDFYTELKKLVVKVEIPENIDLKDRFKLDTVYADKDKTLTLPEGGKPDDEMAGYISAIVMSGSRFVIVSSNAPEEIMENFVEPAKRRLEGVDLKDGQLDGALLRFKAYYNNSLGCFHYDIAKKEFVVKYEIKDTIPDNAKAMIFKIYIKAFLEYLADAGSKTVNGTKVMKAQKVIKGLRQIYEKLNPAEVNRLMALTDPSEICEAFKKLVEPYKDKLGTAKGNIYIRTWADAFVTTETAKAAASLQNLFPKWAQNRAAEILKRIRRADNKIYHGKLQSARELFREGEDSWFRAKNSPDKDKVKDLADKAIGKFKAAKKILDTLPVKEANAKRLLELIQGDRPEERIAGHIGRSLKTVKESREVIDLYGEGGTVKSDVTSLTRQYLHADPKGLIHATIGLFIFTPGGDVIFQRRAPNKVLFPNMLTLAACGHTQQGDNMFEALEDEISGETGILNISSRPIVRIGDPAKIKDSTVYDQRIDLIAYEFVATTKEEAEALRHIGEEINKREKEASKSIFDRLICNYNEEIWTLTLYAFGWNKKAAIAEQAKSIAQQKRVPIGDVNYNREVKALYAYAATEEDMGILEGKKTEHKEEEISKFEKDTRSIEEIARDFQNNPEKYPDTFIPTFTDPVIVKQLADIQKRIRESAKSNGLRLADNGLASEGYIPGRAIQRKPAIGGYDYSYFNYWESQAGDFALKLHKGEIGADAWFDEWYVKNIKPKNAKAEKERYVAGLVKLMKHPQRGEWTTEELYGEIVSLRERLFGKSVVDEYNRQIIERLKEEGKILADFFDENIRGLSGREKILAAIFAEFRPDIVRSIIEGKNSPRIELEKLKDWLRYDMPIDDISEFMQASSKPTHYVHVAGSVNSLAADLKVFGQWLLEEWGNRGKVTFVVKERRFTDEAAKADIDALLELDEFKELSKNKRFNIVVSGVDSPGFNLNRINDETKDLLREAQENRAVFGFKGEANNHTINRIGISHFRLFLSREIETKRTVGIFWDENEHQAPTPAVLKVPAWIPLSDRWTKAITTSQFYEARRHFDKKHGNYDAAAKNIQREGGTFVENIYPEALLLPLKYEGDLKDEYARADKKKFPTLLSYARYKRQQLLDERAEEAVGKGNYISGLYVFKEEPRAGKRVVKNVDHIAKDSDVPIAGKDNVLVKGGFFALRGWNFVAGRAEALQRPYSGEKRTLISHDSIYGLDPEMRVSFNLLYFFTPNLLVDVYNKYRRDEMRYAELVEDVNFYLDAYKPPAKRKGAETEEMIPVYNKGYVGMTEDGGIVFGRRRLLGGELRVKIDEEVKTVLSWDKEAVYNDLKSPEFQDGGQTTVESESETEDIVVYTPMISKIDDNFDSKYNNGAKVYAGKGRVNLIVYNNKIHRIIKGDVMLPSMGVVISLSEKKFGELFGDLTEVSKNQNDGEGRVVYDWKQKPELEWTFNWPKNTPKLKWYYGGSALLVKDGDNLVETQDKEEENFKKEGWFNLLSMQTQENPVQSWKRVPKMIIGVTDKNRFFAVSFSGRGPIYKGASFAEAISIIEKHLQKGEKIKDAFNLDGGSSVSFNVLDKDGMLLTTSWPCIGPDNAEGIRRPISSYAYLAPKPGIKSSSAGTFEALDKEILAAQDILLKARPEELNYEHIKQTFSKLRQLRSQIRTTARAELTDEERMALYSRIQAQENILHHMLIADAAARVGSDGQIIFDPSIIPDAQQRQAVVRQFRAVRAALEGSMSTEDKASTQVCLLEDILSDEVKLARNAILISDQQKLQKTRLLKIDGGINNDNSYIIAPYLVALARGLLSINANNYDKLINNIERLHLKITRQPLNRTLKEALKEGSLNVFPLIVDLLPGVEAVDKNYIERLQRQAWAALIAA